MHVFQIKMSLKTDKYLCQKIERTKTGGNGAWDVLKTMK